ncbi:MAG: hypothetical protein ACR2ND_02600 [Solirubrobacteraceae bacterium]
MITITGCAAIWCSGVAISVLLLVVHPNPPAGHGVLNALNADTSGLAGFAANQQSQGAKTALYAATFAVILPLALLFAPRVIDAIAAGPSAPAVPRLAGVLIATLAGVLVAARLSAHLPWGDGLSALLGAMVIWGAAAGTTLARAARGHPWPWLLKLADTAFPVYALGCVFVFLLLLCVTRLTAVSVPVIAIGTVAVVAVVMLFGRRAFPRLSPPFAVATDVAILIVVLLAVPDIVVFTTSGAIPNAFEPPGIIEFHHDFLLGPANQLLGGGALLVNDPVSQYGVGSIYFLTSWFRLAPIGYGTYAALDGILTALFYGAAYGVLRVAGVGRMLAGSAVAVAVVGLVYNFQYPVGALPQQGPLRFGLPMALILATVCEARFSRLRSVARVAALAVVAVSAIWALEAFAYTAITFAAMTVVQALLLPDGGSRRWFLRRVVMALGACVLAHSVLAGATLVATGELPHWGQYTAYVQAFLLGGKAGMVTYGFERWSPALVIGAAYLASAAAIVLLVWRSPPLAQRNRTVLIALAGVTAYCIALFSYTDNRSSTYLLPYVTLPAVVMGALWLSMLLRSRSVSLNVRRRGLAFALSTAVLVAAAAWPSAEHRFGRTALAHAYPGGGLQAALHRLWHPPPIDPRSTSGEQLLARFLPGQRRVLVLLPVSTDLGIETMMRSGRSNRLPVGDPIADSFVSSEQLPGLRRAIAKLRPGERALTEPTAIAQLAMFAANPSIDPLVNPAPLVNPLESWILQQIGKRFRLRPLQKQGGLVVAELVRRG